MASLPSGRIGIGDWVLVLVWLGSCVLVWLVGLTGYVWIRPGSLQLELNVYLSSLEERQTDWSHKAGSAARGDKVRVDGVSKGWF